MSKINNPIVCGTCGENTEIIDDPSLVKGVVCPKCGNEIRSSSFETYGTIRVGGVYSDHLERNGRTVAVKEERFDGRRAEAELVGDDKVRSSIVGPSPQGEEDSLRTCRILIQKLKSLGANWKEPEFVNDGVIDCVAVDRDDPKKKLSIQIVRGNIRQDIWKKLASNGIYENSESIQEIADRIREAIEIKAKKILPAIRSDIILALDATLLPGSCFSVVVSRLKEQHGEWINQLGFQGVWLIGPDESLTKRLDC